MSDIKVNVSCNSAEDWKMSVVIYAFHPVNFIYTFEIDEPYLYSLNDWMKLITGNIPISLGRISVDEYGYYRFSVGVTDPGSECRVFNSMRIDDSRFSTELSKALNEAVELNLKFAAI